MFRQSTKVLKIFMRALACIRSRHNRDVAPAFAQSMPTEKENSAGRGLPYNYG
jgi:hypothetical protein